MRPTELRASPRRGPLGPFKVRSCRAPRIRTFLELPVVKRLTNYRFDIGSRADSRDGSPNAPAQSSGYAAAANGPGAESRRGSGEEICVPVLRLSANYLVLSWDSAGI